MDTKLSHHCWASKTPDGRGWRGKFSAPGVGVAYVRDEDGVPMRFESEERALIAAQRAMCDRLDDSRAPVSSLAAQVFKVHRNGKNVRTEAVRQRETRR